LFYLGFGLFGNVRLDFWVWVLLMWLFGGEVFVSMV